MIVAGRVRVNGEVVKELGVRVVDGQDVIQVDNKPLMTRERLVYYVLNKPKGIVTTRKDPQGRPTVIDLLTGVKERIYPVGRLDQDTEGLLLLTNDGELAFRLTHPRYGVEKTYHARLRGHVGEHALRALAEGILLEDGMTAPAKVGLLHREGGASWIALTIHEGRNRQVRRMAEAIGHPVIELVRVSFGPISLEGLKFGAYRKLTIKEITLLKAAAGTQASAVEKKGGETWWRNSVWKKD